VQHLDILKLMSL